MITVRVLKALFGLSRFKEYELYTDENRAVFKEVNGSYSILIPITRLNEIEIIESYLIASWLLLRFIFKAP